MNRIATSTLVGLSALMLAAPLSAQMCNGTASFSAGKMNAGLGFSSGDFGSSLDGSFKYGATSGFYGGATISSIDYDGLADGGTGYGINGGKSVVIGAAKKVEMCPQLFLNGSSGPGNFSTMSLGGGVSFGGKLETGTTFDLIPFGGAFIARNSVDTGVGTNSDVDLGVNLGAGFVFNKVWSVRPIVSFPITGDNRDATFGIMGLYNFGK